MPQTPIYKSADLWTYRWDSYGVHNFEVQTYDGLRIHFSDADDAWTARREALAIFNGATT